MTDWAYTKHLGKEQWAWEFLRRNSEYQRYYKVFIHRWRGLEEDYVNFGKLPDPENQRWQNDLRSLLRMSGMLK